MPPIRDVTVYCSSVDQIAPAYHAAARELGTAIASHHWGLVYGGNSLGLMKSLADAVRAGGGRVVGITPRLFIDKGYGDDRCDELVIAPSMRERKQIMEQRGDALIALPGGLGTLEEIFEVIVARQLGFIDKPIILINIQQYYRPLLAMIDHGVTENFIRPKALGAFFVANTVAEAIGHLV